MIVTVPRDEAQMSGLLTWHAHSAIHPLAYCAVLERHSFHVRVIVCFGGGGALTESVGGAESSVGSMLNRWRRWRLSRQS